MAINPIHHPIQQLIPLPAHPGYILALPKILLIELDLEQDILLALVLLLVDGDGHLVVHPLDQGVVPQKGLLDILDGVCIHLMDEGVDFFEEEVQEVLDLFRREFEQGVDFL